MLHSYNCDNCGEIFTGNKARHTKKFIKKGSQKFGYCSRKCRTKHQQVRLYVDLKCQTCGTKFKRRTKKVSKNNFCSQSCSATHSNQRRKKKPTNPKRYREACKFSFSLSEYPNEFDFNLLRKHGIYHPNKNPSGVSRDHIISVRHGFENNISPRIISHPANCQLLLQKINASKGLKCDMTLNKLNTKIKSWDKKYPPTP